MASVRCPDRALIFQIETPASAADVIISRGALRGKSAAVSSQRRASRMRRRRAKLGSAIKAFGDSGASTWNDMAPFE